MTNQEIFEYVRSKNIEKVKEYLEQGGDVEALQDSSLNLVPLLHFSCAEGNVEITKLLLENGADPYREAVFFHPINKLYENWSAFVMCEKYKLNSMLEILNQYKQKEQNNDSR